MIFFLIINYIYLILIFTLFVSLIVKLPIHYKRKSLNYKIITLLNLLSMQQNISSHRYEDNKCQLVRQSCQFVMQHATQVKIVPQNIPLIAAKFHYKKFNQYEHHDVGEDQQQVLKYLFVLDSCNFCFWPLQGFQYQQLAQNIRSYINSGVSLQKLSKITETQLVQDMFQGIRVPLAKQRARLVREVCSTVYHKFNGSFTKIVTEANKSAVELLNILTSNFPNFQDHSIYKGHQIFFYKRAQILIAGVWGRYQGKGLGEFTDIKQITMFADYRVPQILNQYKVLEYTEELKNCINEKRQIPSGSRDEVQLRAATIIAVEMIKDYINNQLKKSCFTLEVDHFLWQLGEQNLGKIVDHHRTLTIYY